MIEFVKTEKAPTPGLYNQGILSSGSKYLFIAGQTGNISGVEGEPVIEGGIGPQTTQALKNLVAIVERAWRKYTWTEPAKCFVAIDIFLKDPGTPEARTTQRELFNAAYEAFFREYGISKNELPARCMVWVSEVPLESPLEDTVVEIKGIAAI